MRPGSRRRGLEWQAAAVAAAPQQPTAQPRSHLLRLLGHIFRIISTQCELSSPVCGLAAGALLLFQRLGPPALLKGPRQLLHAALHCRSRPWSPQALKWPPLCAWRGLMAF